MENNTKIQRTSKYERKDKPAKHKNFLNGKFMNRLTELQGNDTGEVIADKIDVSPGIWSDYKNGKKLPELQRAILIAEKFKISLDWLFSPDDNVDAVDGKFFKRLKQLQGDKSDKEIANKIGISSDIWARYIKGERVPTIQIALKIAKEFNVSLDWLFSPYEDYDSKKEKIDPTSEAKQSFLALANLIEGNSNIWRVTENGIKECGNPKYDMEGDLLGGCDAKYYPVAVVAKANLFSDFIEEYDKFYKSIKSLMKDDSIERIEQTYYEKKAQLINDFVDDYLKYLEKVNSKNKTI